MKICIRTLATLVALLVMVSCSPKEERYEAFIQKAQKYEEQSQYAEAKIEARNAIKLNPNSIEAYLILGRCAVQEQDIRSAYSAFTRVLELSPNQTEATIFMARITLNSGNTEQAIVFIENILKTNPDSIDARNMLAAVYLRQNRFQDAKNILEGILKSSPDNFEALAGLASLYTLQKMPSEAKKILLEALQRSPGSIRLTTLLLNQAMADNNYTEAQIFLQLLLNENPENQTLILRQSELYFKVNNPSKGYSTLEEHLEKYPAADSVRLRLAELYSSNNNASKAIAILKDAPQDTPEIKLIRAVAMLKGGQNETGLNLLKEVASNNISSQSASKAQLIIADIYSRNGQNNDAIRELSLLLQRTPSNLEALSKRGQLYMAQRQFENAISDLRIVAIELPDDHITAITIANAQNALGNSHVAEGSLKEVLKKSPSNALAYLTLANLYLQQQKPDDAIALLHFGRNKVGNIADIHFAEADILVSVGRHLEAIDILKKLALQEKFRLAAQLKMATIYAQAKDYVNSIAIYDSILQQIPDFLEAAEGRIRTQIAAGQIQEALSYAEERQKSRPNDPTAAALVGETALAANNLEKSEKAFLQAMSLEPNWDVPVLRLAQLYSSTDRFSDGIKASETIIKKSPSALAPMLLIALLQEKSGNSAAAEITYRSILSKSPNMPVANNNLANLLSLNSPNQQRLEEAESYAAIASQSGAPEAHSTLGWIYHLQGKPTLAEGELRQALVKAPNDSLIQYRLALVLVALNKKENAKVLLDSVLKKQSDTTIQNLAQKLLESL